MTSIGDHNLESEAAIGRLAMIKPTIEKMMSIGGAVGFCHGVVHQGKIIHKQSFGYRGYDKKLPVDTKTVFPICSMTKGLVNCALGTLVEEGKLSWDTPIHELLPDYAPQDPSLRESTTLIDFLSMRSGLEQYNVWLQSNNRVGVRASDTIRIMNTLRMTSSLRYEWEYNNWGYEVAATVCKSQSGATWDSMLHSRFFEPMGLNNTDARGDRDDLEKVSKSYMVLDNGDPVQIPVSQLSGKTAFGAAGGVVSCVDDLLQLYQVILAACKDQFASCTTSTPNSPFKQLPKIMSAHQILPGASFRESTYGLGWIRTELPNKMCKISPNYGALGHAPVVGEGAPSKLIIAHYGSMPGAYSAVLLFPETDSIIVVLTNTTPRCDFSDWTSQLLTETLFDFPCKHDYAEWTQKTVDAELAWYGDVSSELKRRRDAGKPHGALSSYIGHYYNESKTLLLCFRMGIGGLVVAFDGRDDDAWQLSHAGGTTFSWLQPRDDLVRRGRNVSQPLAYYLFHFETNNDATASNVYWTHDPNFAEGERYARDKNFKA